MALLRQHVASKTAPATVNTSSQTPHPPQALPSIQRPPPNSYTQVNGYNSYAAPINTASSSSQANDSYLPNNPVAQVCVPAVYSDPQHTYHPPYTRNTSTYDSSSYPSNDGLPATAAAANAYLNGYPPQPAPLNPTFQPNIPNPNYNHYHSPGSPTSWRNWAGSMASNLEPGADYMNSASALLQLGGRSEGPVSQDFAVANSTGQGWPLMLFDSNTGNAP